MRPSRLGLIPAAVTTLLAGVLLTGCSEFGIPVPAIENPTATESDGGDGKADGGEPQWVAVRTDAFEMTVVEIIDGDTLRAELAATNDVVTTTSPIAIRLIGIDTPETYPDEECFGPQAQAALGILAPVGSVVLVSPDVDSWDDYDRRLFYVWTETGVFVNEALALAGYADVHSYPPNTTLQNELQAAEDRAKDANRGLWGACS